MAVKSNQRVKARPVRLLQNQRGVAMVEMLFLLAIFVTLFGMAFGFWTAIHRGTLQSIGARHYAFEVINNRTHFIYHRDTKKPVGNDKAYYRKNGSRFFAIVEKQSILSPKLKPVKRDLSLFNKDSMSIDPVDWRDGDRANPIRLKVGYGICIDCECSGPNNTVGCDPPGQCQC